MVSAITATNHRTGVVPATELGGLMVKFSDIEDDLEHSAIRAILADLNEEAANLDDKFTP